MSAINLCVVYLATISCCEAYKILAVHPAPARSHAAFGNGIVRNLLKEGHEVTYISPFPYEPASSKVRWIDVSDNLKLPGNLRNLGSIINNRDEGDVRQLLDTIVGFIKATVDNVNVQRLLNDPNEQFDAVIAEWMFELPAGFAAIFQCPLIWFSSVEVHWAMLRLIDQPTNPAFSGHIFSTFSPPFTFWQRVIQLYYQLEVYFLKYLFLDEFERLEYEKMFAPIAARRGIKLPSYYDVQFNASLVLGSSHVSIGDAVALPQNYIAIGGFHIEDSLDPLPEDLKEIMDNAKNGVIYFSMGSCMKSKDIPKEIIKSLVQMFSELDQIVLWKFEENLPNKPKNVHVFNWAPQLNILAHPNTVLFISHGGLLSIIETVHFGVPVIGIPLFADQFINIDRAVKRGFALRVDHSYNMAEDLKHAIEEMITNSRYTEKAKELSFAYHDRPLTPGKELVHWVKHVIATRGAPHLRSPALHVPFYQKLYLDLLVFILLILFLGVKTLKLIFALCRRKVHSNKKDN